MRPVINNTFLLSNAQTDLFLNKYLNPASIPTDSVVSVIEEELIVKPLERKIALRGRRTLANVAGKLTSPHHS